jgi:glutamine synthetase
MLGSSQSIADPNVALNTIMAEELGKFADELEGASDFDAALRDLIFRTFTEHQRIIFNGNGYSREWEEEAARRGLSNLRSTAKALPSYISQKNIDLVTKHGIYTETEFRARHEIHLEAYCKIINIEALTSVDMAIHQILPAAMAYSKSLCEGALVKKQMGISPDAETALIADLSAATNAAYSIVQQLKTSLESIPNITAEAVDYYHEVIVPLMENLRREADILEELTDKKFWPYPTYSDLLYY